MEAKSKSFLSSLWGGVRRFFRWFFGYSAKGRYAQGVWCVITTSLAIFLLCLAVRAVYRTISMRNYQQQRLYSRDLFQNFQVSDDIYFHETNGNDGYVFNAAMKNKTIDDVEWVAKPMEGDTLVCFCDGKKRGFFGMNDGKVVLKPDYDRAWVFSEGLAAVVQNDIIKFIDNAGKTVIDTKKSYKNSRYMDFVFHGGFCPVPTAEGRRFDLMDKTGKIVMEGLSFVKYDKQSDCWMLKKDSVGAVFDASLNQLIPWTECARVDINDNTIDLVMNDHTIRKYDMTGKLVNDFCVRSVKLLIYKEDKVEYRSAEYDEEGNFTTIHFLPKAVANLRAYEAGEGFKGLMTAEGKVITMPLYTQIKAMGPDLYLCQSANGDGIFINGKGEPVKQDKPIKQGE